jgi:hypothetical protein
MMPRKSYWEKRRSKGKRCLDCGNPITNDADRCPSCAQVVRWMIHEQLNALLSLSAEHKAQAYVDALARSLVPPMARGRDAT